MDNALSFALWAIIIGVLLISMVLSGSLLKRLPLSTAMLYLGAGSCTSWSVTSTW